MSNNAISPMSAGERKIQMEESSGHFRQGSRKSIVEETIDSPTEAFEAVTQEIEELKEEPCKVQ